MKTKLVNFAGKTYEVTTKKWTKPYNQIKIPTGWELLEDFEVMQMIRTGDLKARPLALFACKQLPIDVRENRSRWLILHRDLSLYSVWDRLDDSDAVGRVCFKKQVTK